MTESNVPQPQDNSRWAFLRRLKKQLQAPSDSPNSPDSSSLSGMNRKETDMQPTTEQLNAFHQAYKALLDVDGLPRLLPEQRRTLNVNEINKHARRFLWKNFQGNFVDADGRINPDGARVFISDEEKKRILQEPYYHGTATEIQAEKIRKNGFAFLYPELTSALSVNRISIISSREYARKLAPAEEEVFTLQISPEARIATLNWNFVNDYIIPQRIIPAVNSLFANIDIEDSVKKFYHKEASRQYLVDSGIDIINSGRGQLEILNLAAAAIQLPE
jgi:hypothetical protein